MLDLTSILKSGEYSDFRIKYNDVSFHVHKTIVCPQSKYLQGACSRNFKEGQDGFLNIEDDYPVDVFEAVLTFLYSGEYQVDEARKPEDRANFHISVYKLADFMAIDSLMKCAATSLKFVAKWDLTMDRRMMDGWVRDAYNNTAKRKNPLRVAIAECVHTHREAIFNPKGNEDILNEIPGFAVDYVNAALAYERENSFIKVRRKLDEDEESFECPECDWGFRMIRDEDKYGADDKTACPSCHIVAHTRAFTVY